MSRNRTFKTVAVEAGYEDDEQYELLWGRGEHDFRDRVSMVSEDEDGAVTVYACHSEATATYSTDGRRLLRNLPLADRVRIALGMSIRACRSPGCHRA